MPEKPGGVSGKALFVHVAESTADIAESEELNMDKNEVMEWIYRPLNFPQELEKTLEAVEKALGFKLFIWQKTFIANGTFRQYGATTAEILRMLLCEDIFINFTKPPKNNMERFFRTELLEIKGKLDAAGVPTNKVYTNAGELYGAMNARAKQKARNKA